MLACISSRARPSVGCGKSARNVVVSSLLVTQVVALSWPVTGMLPDQTYQSGQAMKIVGNGLAGVSDQDSGEFRGSPTHTVVTSVSPWRVYEMVCTWVPSPFVGTGL